MTVPAAIRQLEDEIVQKADVLDVNALRQKIFAVGQAYRQACYGQLEVQGFGECDQLLTAWTHFLDRYDDTLVPIVKGIMRCQRHETAGDMWQQRATWEYYQNADAIATPTMFETAEACYARAIESLEVVSVDPTDAKLTSLREETLVIPRAALLEARGMLLFTQGEFDLEAGDLLRAEAKLAGAIEAMRSAEHAKCDPAASAAAELSSLHFLDLAEALRHQARSDQAVLQGDLAAAAAEQAARADALERCRAVHARAHPAQSDASPHFAKRLAREAFFARQRQNRYQRAAVVKPRHVWLKPAIFVGVTALLGAFLFVGRWLAHPGQTDTIAQELMAIGIFAVIAGVGSTLITWSEGADAVLKALTAVGGKKS